MTERYFQGIQKETEICKVFQKYIESKRPGLATFLKQRNNAQAPIDFLGRVYDKETNETVKKLAVEVRSLSLSKEEIEKETGYIDFPISKLNELMKFRRMGMGYFTLSNCFQ